MQQSQPQNNPGKMKMNPANQAEIGFRKTFGMRPVIAVDPSRRVGPFCLDVQLPTAAGDVSVISDDAFWGDPRIRARWSPTNGSSAVNQTVQLHIEKVELIIIDGDLLLQTAAVVDDLFAANPHLYGVIQGQPWAIGLVDHMRAAFEIANNSNATPGAYPRGFRGMGPLLLDVPIEPNGKLGDSLVLRTDGALTVALDCKLKVWGWAADAGLDDGTDPRSPYAQGCSGSLTPQAMAQSPNPGAPSGATMYRDSSLDLVTLG